MSECCEWQEQNKYATKEKRRLNNKGIREIVPSLKAALRMFDISILFFASANLYLLDFVPINARYNLNISHAQCMLR